MSQPIEFHGDKVLAVLHEHVQSKCAQCHLPKKAFTGHVQMALIPENQFSPVKEEIDAVLRAIKDVHHERRNFLTEGQIQQAAAECQDCNLCMTCAGKHHTYSRQFSECWPPGKLKCFAFMLKQGSPIRDTPCELCSRHDEHLRTAIGDRSRSLSKESKLRTQLQNLHSKRQ